MILSTSEHSASESTSASTKFCFRGKAFGQYSCSAEEIGLSHSQLSSRAMLDLIARVPSSARVGIHVSATKEQSARLPVGIA